MFTAQTTILTAEFAWLSFQFLYNKQYTVYAKELII